MVTLTPQVFWSIWILGMYGCSGVGMFVLASDGEWHGLRHPLRMLGALWLIVGIIALRALWLEVYVDCDQLSGVLWWFAGCAFRP